MYLATVINYYTDRLMGFVMEDHMRISLIEDALKKLKDSGEPERSCFQLETQKRLYVKCIPRHLYAS